MGDRAGGDAAQRAEENRSAEAQQEVRVCVCELENISDTHVR